MNLPFKPNISSRGKIKYIYLNTLLALYCLFSFQIKFSLGGLERYNKFISEENTEESENKLSEMCAFVADRSCQKCIDLAVCFWCGKRSENAVGQCYAIIDKKAKYECQGQQVYNKGTCSYKYAIQENEIKKKKILINLLNLFKKLHFLNSKKKEKEGNISKSITSFISENKKSEYHINTINTPLMNIQNFSRNSDIGDKIISNNVTSLPLNYHEIIFNNSSLSENFYTHHLQDCSHLNNNVCELSVCVWCEALRKCVLKSGFQQNECNPSLLTQNIVKEASMCRTKVSCKTCTEYEDCYWCDKTKLCHSFIDASLISNECSEKWFHRSCSNQSVILFFILPALGCLLMMGVGYVCVKHCYYQQLKPVEVKLEEQPMLFKEKNGRTIYQIAESEEEDEDEKSIAEKSGSIYQKLGKNYPSVW